MYQYDSGLYGMYVRFVGQYGVLGISHQKSEISVNGTSKVEVNGESVGFQLKLYLVKGISGGNAECSGEIQFGEEGPAVLYRGDTHGGVWGINLSYVANR